MIKDEPTAGEKKPRLKGRLGVAFGSHIPIIPVSLFQNTENRPSTTD